MERYRPNAAKAIPAATPEPSPFSGSTEVRLLKQMAGDVAARLSELDATAAPAGSYKAQEAATERQDLIARQSTVNRRLDLLLNPPRLSVSQTRSLARREAIKASQIASRRRQLEQAAADADQRGEYRQARIFRGQKLDVPAQVEAEWSL